MAPLQGSEQLGYSRISEVMRRHDAATGQECRRPLMGYPVQFLQRRNNGRSSRADSAGEGGADIGSLRQGVLPLPSYAALWCRCRRTRAVSVQVEPKLLSLFV